MLALAMLAVLLLVVFSTTAVGRTLRTILVENPAKRLSGIEFGQVVLYGALGIAGFILFLLFEIEGVRLLAFMAPDIVVWFTAFDVSLFLDIITLGITLSATTRLRVIVTAVIRRIQQVRPSAVAKVFGHARAKARPSRGVIASDEPDPVGYALVPA